MKKKGITLPDLPDDKYSLFDNLICHQIRLSCFSGIQVDCSCTYTTGWCDKVSTGAGGGDNTWGLGLQHVGKPQPERCTNALWSTFVSSNNNNKDDRKLNQTNRTSIFPSWERRHLYYCTCNHRACLSSLWPYLQGNQRYRWKQWYRRVWCSLNVDFFIYLLHFFPFTCSSGWGEPGEGVKK